jgi:uncharacterized protein (TIGR02246 family)
MKETAMSRCPTIRPLIAVVGIVGLAGSSAVVAQRAGGADSNVRAAIVAANKKFIDGAAKGDAALIASAYTDDAEAFPANSDVVKGRAAIQKMWQSVLASGINGFDLNTTEVEADGNLAYEVGTYAMKLKDGEIADRGKYCVVWKRVKGEWLLHRDIWTTSVPAATK